MIIIMILIIIILKHRNALPLLFYKIHFTTTNTENAKGQQPWIFYYFYKIYIYDIFILYDYYRFVQEAIQQLCEQPKFE